MLGAIVGDIVGSIYEFDNHKSKDFPLFQERCEFTDDTILTIATADALMDDWDFASKYRRYGARYPSSYGGFFREWIHDESQGPYNGFGNGSAMRVSPVAWFEDKEHRVMELAKRSAEVTHNHPEGIKGAQATAMAILWVRQGLSQSEIVREVENSDLPNITKNTPGFWTFAPQYSQRRISHLDAQRLSAWDLRAEPGELAT